MDVVDFSFIILKVNNFSKYCQILSNIVKILSKSIWKLRTYNWKMKNKWWVRKIFLLSICRKEKNCECSQFVNVQDNSLMTVVLFSVFHMSLCQFLWPTIVHFYQSMHFSISLFLFRMIQYQISIVFCMPNMCLLIIVPCVL